MFDIGRYVVALAVNDGPFGGEVVVDGSIFLLCLSIGPNVCQISSIVVACSCFNTRMV